jgi:hypothetical protein
MAMNHGDFMDEPQDFMMEVFSMRGCETPIPASVYICL